MELLKFFFLVTLLIAFVAANPANKLKNPHKSKNANRPAAAPVSPALPPLNRAKRQYGFGGGFSGASANANAASFSNGGGGYSPFGYGSPFGGGFSGSSAFASANAASNSFGR